MTRADALGRTSTVARLAPSRHTPTLPSSYPPSPKQEATISVLAGPRWNNYIFVPWPYLNVGADSIDLTTRPLPSAS